MAGLAPGCGLRYGAGMVVMIWIGAALTIAGLGGVLWCIRKAVWMKRTKLDDQAIRSEIGRLIFVNMAAVFAAFLGLGLLVTGLILT